MTAASIPHSSQPRFAGLTHFARACMRSFAERRTLRTLEQLDDRMLRDIGLTRSDLGAIRFGSR